MTTARAKGPVKPYLLAAGIPVPIFLICRTWDWVVTFKPTTGRLSLAISCVTLMPTFQNPGPSVASLKGQTGNGSTGVA